MLLEWSAPNGNFDSFARATTGTVSAATAVVLAVSSTFYIDESRLISCCSRLVIALSPGLSRILTTSLGSSLARHIGRCILPVSLS